MTDQQNPYQPQPQPQQSQPQQQPPYQQVPPQQMPNQQFSGQPFAGQQVPIQTADAVYKVSDNDKQLRLVAFIFMIISTISTCWTVIALAWMIPMTIVCWDIYKGKKPNGTAFGVCTLLFGSLVSGICLLISTKEK